MSGGAGVDVVDSGSSDLSTDPTQPGRKSHLRDLLRGVGVVACLVLLIVVAAASLRYGSIPVSNAQLLEALFGGPDSWERTAILDWRLPRTVIAILVGAGLAVGGAVTQGVTRNPMADPYILGVSSGAAFAMTAAIYYTGIRSPQALIWPAFAGAILASAIVYIVSSGGRGGGSPVRIILSGVITGILMGTWTSVMIYTSQETREAAAYLLIGSVAGRNLSDLIVPLSCIVIGTLACLFLGHQLNVLNLGEDAARALGMNTTVMRLVFVAIVVFIAGAAVCVAGPIGFVGLVVPHIVRSLVGSDYRWVLIYSALGGPLLLLIADLLGRVAVAPEELDAGIVMAVIGAPFFIYLARQRLVAR